MLGGEGAAGDPDALSRGAVPCGAVGGLWEQVVLILILILIHHALSILPCSLALGWNCARCKQGHDSGTRGRVERLPRPSVPLPTGPDLGVSWHRPPRAPLAQARVPRAALYR